MALIQESFSEIMDGVIDEYESTGTHWIALKIRKFIGNKNIITNIYRRQPYDSIMCRYFCTGFVDFMLNGKSSGW